MLIETCTSPMKKLKQNMFQVECIQALTKVLKILVCIYLYVFLNRTEMFFFCWILLFSLTLYILVTLFVYLVLNMHFIKKVWTDCHKSYKIAMICEVVLLGKFLSRNSKCLLVMSPKLKSKVYLASNVTATWGSSYVGKNVYIYSRYIHTL